MRTLILDNDGSFTFNLFQRLAVINGEPPVVLKNDALGWPALAELASSCAFDNIVLSPGPGSPVRASDFGVCGEVLLRATVPILGVCLGHQGIGHVFGGEVRHAPEPRHGQLSPIFHDGSELWHGIPQGFRVVRYHSLVVGEPLPPVLVRSAWTEDGVLMGLGHRERDVWGVQFHPESIGTEFGDTLLENFRNLTRERRPGAFRRRPAPAQKETRRPVEGERRDLRLHVRRLDRFVDPEACFLSLFSASREAFWLDSSRVMSGLSRFSYMGAGDGPHSVSVAYDVGSGELTERRGGSTRRLPESIYTYLDRQLRVPQPHDETLPFDFQGGYVGYFGYELKGEAGATRRHQSSTPDARFLLADRFLAFDHHAHVLYLLCLAGDGEEGEVLRWFDETETKVLAARVPERAPPTGRSVSLRLARNRARYLEDIAACQRHIREGESYELCLTNQLHTDALGDPLEVYRTLRAINPAPYAALLRFGEVNVLSSSPERFLRIDASRWVESKPIKGTRPRSADAREDARLRDELAADEKDRAENLIIVDLLRNDLGATCEVGSVEVPKLMAVESYETVHHLVSTVRGKLRDGASVTECIREAFPGGSMTGAPKLRTMNLLDTLEEEARGVYSGAIGFLGFNGTADLNIVIRTLVSTPKGCSVGVGGAIVHPSQPALEFEETLVKARALIHTLATVSYGSVDPCLVDGAIEALRETGEVTL